MTRDSGLWTVGPAVPAGPTAALIEVAGAVLAWRIDDPAGLDAVTVTFTDIAEAEWLWRVVGEHGHVALLAAAEGVEGADGSDALDVSGVQLSADTLAPLRRLAVGHWLRRWWPASARDGIAALDQAVLDGEIALLTTSAQEFLGDDTFDSDVAELIEPHRAALAALVREGDPRVGELATACLELADEFGVGPLVVAAIPSERRRDDYALAAGATRRTGESIAGGVDSVDWTAVPPGLFDAADRTIEWTIQATGAAPVAAVRVAPAGAGAAGSGGIEGIEVRLRSGAIVADGTLTADGRATLPLRGAGGQAITEDLAWGHDWAATAVGVGADVPVADDAATVRDRVREIARARLARPGDDAFLAEVLASESDY